MGFLERERKNHLNSSEENRIMNRIYDEFDFQNSKTLQNTKIKDQKDSQNQECHEGSILDQIKSTRSDTNCSGVDYDDMCGIRKDLVNHHENSRTHEVNKSGSSHQY